MLTSNHCCLRHSDKTKKVEYCCKCLEASKWTEADDQSPRTQKRTHCVSLAHVTWSCTTRCFASCSTHMPVHICTWYSQTAYCCTKPTPLAAALL
jgi:hypothetical protein